MCIWLNPPRAHKRTVNAEYSQHPSILIPALSCQHHGVRDCGLCATGTVVSGVAERMLCPDLVVAWWHRTGDEIPLFLQCWPTLV